MMITWLLLVSLFSKSTQDGNDQENGNSLCGPQNLTLTSSDQMILITWQDEPSCSAVQDVLIYELMVLIADKKEHYEEVAVMPDQIGSTHSWNWTSYLALECASHSVRLRSRHKNHKSPWKQEQTLPGMETSERPEVFPKEKAFMIGSRVTFCCVLPAGKVFKEMYLSEYSRANMNTTTISNQTHALTVLLNQLPKISSINVFCETEDNHNGANVYVGYPPDYSNLTCETRDLESVECYWTEGRKTRWNFISYQLLESFLYFSPCAKMGNLRCSQEVRVEVGEKSWTFTAKNAYGKVELSDTADLIKRVHMLPPNEVTASTVNARNVSLEWRWTVPKYNNLSITCQVNINGDKNTRERTQESFGVGLKFVVLNDLIPNWKYIVKVRCGTTQNFWKWGDWSTTVNLHTKGDVPDALDVWMQMKDKKIITIWKVPLDNQSHGHIEDYEVTWTTTTEVERQNRTKVAPNNHSHALSLDPTEEYIITVTARNINGSSPPSNITIPSLNPDRTRVNTSWIIGSNDGFNLSWSSSPTASCGYIVDWCPTGQCIVEWLKVPPNETKANIFSETFKNGLRYSLSIYACTQGAPVLLEIREGYVREERIQDGLFKSLKGKQQDSDYEVSWDKISLREQTAFIQGYVLYCLDNNNNNNIVNFSTDNPEATSLTARKLSISSYTFTVKAKTAVGECGTQSFTATLNTPTDNLISPVIISLVTVFVLLILIVFLLYRHWTCIKQKVYPPIPKPVLTSTGEHLFRPLLVDQCYHSEADIVDVPELHHSTGAPMNGFACQEDTPSQSGLPSSPSRSIIPNPSYNLIMKHWDQQFNSYPELQEGTSLERSTDEYQPQDTIETFTINQTEGDRDSPMSCVSSYILLPKSSSR
ncbi:leukemia inhibitory factor receptor-like isoform X2 [Sebastes umbrosus]|uniref:leukemia inhibitory factor receptor-like isoform X2 n=1 Tax=Sebastes umbrosus TaxID=72105 RepID=UPI00189E54B9|nr:leukemia inhibitory factor receptor-like isoform X2 [Sebastes umbrosus]